MIRLGKRLGKDYHVKKNRHAENTSYTYASSKHLEDGILKDLQ